MAFQVLYYQRAKKNHLHCSRARHKAAANKEGRDRGVKWRVTNSEGLKLAGAPFQGVIR